MDSKRYLIVNADDFGQSSGINRGIITAHRDGIVTSTSLMVRWPAAAGAVAASQEFPNLSLGLHIDLGEWVYRNERWEITYQVVPVDDEAAVKREARHQLALFRQLVGRDPTHIDSHQHVHRQEPAYSVLHEMAEELAVPLRHYSPVVHYCGDFYGQTGKGVPLPESISVERLIGLLRLLSPGITELGCHPGFPNPADSLSSGYGVEREVEVQTLCNSRVKSTVDAEEIVLRPFHKLSS